MWNEEIGLVKVYSCLDREHMGNCRQLDPRSFRHFPLFIRFASLYFSSVVSIILTFPLLILIDTLSPFHPCSSLRIQPLLGPVSV